MIRLSPRGFTLIELMIVVAIVAIISAIAYPSYQQYVRRTAITEAHMALNGLAQAMERFRAQSGTYMGAAAGGVDSGAPAIFRTQSPENGAAQFSLTISGGADAPSATTYTILATSTGGAVETNASLSLNELGNLGGTLASEVKN